MIDILNCRLLKISLEPSGVKTKTIYQLSAAFFIWAFVP